MTLVISDTLAVAGLANHVAVRRCFRDDSVEDPVGWRSFSMIIRTTMARFGRGGLGPAHAGR